MMNEHNADESRLREHPADREITASQMLDLASALKQLRAESHASIKGHRQATLFHQNPVSLVLFDFAAGGQLPRHVAQGVVTIQVIEGTLTVQLEDHTHRLEQNQVLVLNPGLPHSVQAATGGTMLLTISLVGEKAASHQDS